MEVILWEQIVMMLLGKYEQEINRLMEENVRLNQVLKRHDEE